MLYPTHIQYFNEGKVNEPVKIRYTVENLKRLLTEEQDMINDPNYKQSSGTMNIKLVEKGKYDSMILREQTDRTYCDKNFVHYSRARYEYFTNRLNITKFKIIRPINQSKFYKSKNKPLHFKKK